MLSYNLTREDISQICFLFMFEDESPSEFEQIEFSKKFGVLFPKIIRAVKAKQKLDDKTARELYTKYKKGFDIVMEYWESLHDDDKTESHKRLTKLGL